MDHPLYWGRGQALYEISGTEVLVDVSPGENYPLEVDHSIDATYAHADPPVIEAVDGVNFLLCCDGTDGDGWKVLVMVDADFAGGDYGYGAYGSPDIIVNWTRKGVLSAPA